jgi:hypothetical protein
VTQFLSISGLKSCMDIHDDKSFGPHGHGKDLAIYLFIFYFLHSCVNRDSTHSGPNNGLKLRARTHLWIVAL